MVLGRREAARTYWTTTLKGAAACEITAAGDGVGGVCGNEAVPTAGQCGMKSGATYYRWSG